MKILLIIYGISWFILLLIFISSVIKDGFSKSKTPWYVYAVMIIFAPLIVLASPILLFQKKTEDKEVEMRKEDWKKRDEERRQKIMTARHQYHEAMSSGFNSVSEDFISKAEKLHADVECNDYSKILNILDKLSLPSGSTLCVVPGSKEGSGSNSHIAVRCNNDNIDMNIWNHVVVEDSPMGAWQVYLLNSLWHSLPYYWHGGYAKRSFVFSEKDFYNIHFIRKEDSRLITAWANLNVTPEIIKHNGKYYISCCYWSNWGGLIRELAVISIENGRVVDIHEDGKYSTLYEYDCMIMF